MNENMDEIDDCTTCPENSFEESKIYKINRHMISAKITYFLNSCRISTNDFLLMYYLSIGFDSITARTFIGYQFVTAFVAAPLWSFLADAQGIHKHVSLTLCTCAAFIICLQPVFGAIFGDSSTYYCSRNLTDNSSITHGDISNSNWLNISESNNNTKFVSNTQTTSNLSFNIPSRYIANSRSYSILDDPLFINMFKNSPPKNGLSFQKSSKLPALYFSVKPPISPFINLSSEFIFENSNLTSSNVSYNSSNNESFFPYKNFPLLLGIMITGSFGAIFDGAITSFADSGVLRRIYSSPIRTEYGYQASMSSLGYATGAFLCALSTQFFVMLPTSCEAGLFIIYLISTTLLSFSIYLLYNDMDLNPDAHSPKIVSKIFTLTIFEFNTWLFFLSAFIGGILQGSWYMFIFSYMKDLSPPNYLFFIIIGIGAFSSGLTFIGTNKIVNLVHGPSAAICLSSFIWSVRFVWLAYSPSSYIILPNYILQGPSEALYAGASYEYIKRNSDPRVYTIMCGLYNAIRLLGIAITNLFGGMLYRTFGGWVFYLIASLLACLWCILTLSYAAYKSYTKTDYELVNISDDDI